MDRWAQTKSEGTDHLLSLIRVCIICNSVKHILNAFSTVRPIYFEFLGAQRNIELCQEKTCFSHIYTCENKVADQLRNNRAAYLQLCSDQLRNQLIRSEPSLFEYIQIIRQPTLMDACTFQLYSVAYILTSKNSS